MMKSGRLKFFTPEELHRFLAEAHRWGPKFDLIYWLMFYLGLRTGELIRIKLSDIANNGVGVTGLKNGLTMTYPLCDPLPKKLRAWLRRRKASEVNPYLFPGERMNPLGHISHDVVKDNFYRIQKAASLSGRSPHSLRHSCAVQLAEANHSAIRIQHWLRHRNLSSSQVYFSLIADERFKPEAAATLTSVAR